MVTKKCYAGWMTAKENAVDIKKLTDNIVDRNDTKELNNALLKIKEMNDKFISDFGDTDLKWTPPNKRNVEKNIVIEDDDELLL